MNDRKAQISSNLAAVRERIVRALATCGRTVDEVELIAVTKTFPVSDVEILYELGLRNFGENRDQEGSQKSPLLPSDAIWHFQGQIQSNKLKSIAEWADVIHSIDEIRHARKLNELVNGPKSIFIQVSLDENPAENRGGVAPTLLKEFLQELEELENLNPIGLMAVAPIDQEPDLAFSRLAEIHKIAKEVDPQISKISAGMSNDFEAAILNGATHIRIGSQILGVR